ncbi:uncharacterized protein VP01_1543g2 [Puccinia sorghi]|uniref:Uncharacterized protein n=1 Tax=Puccinia sorghi TaxID=27349 RepID=A0A0L6VIX2_9BASI|nr:uncharacterized protein VP01_1543g2 [Puccinia sorghi]
MGEKKAILQVPGVPESEDLGLGAACQQAGSQQPSNSCFSHGIYFVFTFATLLKIISLINAPYKSCPTKTLITLLRTLFHVLRKFFTSLGSISFAAKGQPSKLNFLLTTLAAKFYTLTWLLPSGNLVLQPTQEWRFKIIRTSLSIPYPTCCNTFANF